MAVSIRSNIVESIKTQTVINNLTNLTSMLQPGQITQDSPHQTPQVDDLNNLIEKINIEKTTTKGKLQSC